MNHLALFTGINGFGIAADWAGFETIGFSEIDPYCCKLLAQKWPNIKNYGDVESLGNFEPLRGRITVLSAGVPCQPASLAGKRRGEKDDRWLWPATLDVVGLIKPAWCIFENPDGILSMGEFAGVLSRLGSLGYSVRAFRVPASALGAGHQRYRVFFVANAECGEFQRWGKRGELGETQAQEQGEGNQRERSRNTAVDSGKAIADATRQLLNGGRNTGQGRRDEPANSGERKSFTDHCRAQFPAVQRIGDKQHCLRGFWYAQPALYNGSLNPDFVEEYMGFPVGWTLLTGKMTSRASRLKALGNSVCPHQAYPFFRGIVQTETLI